MAGGVFLLMHILYIYETVHAIEDYFSRTPETTIWTEDRRRVEEEKYNNLNALLYNNASVCV